ncbi:MAG: class II fructose-bisphosphatase [Terrimicrobiaceae bacterium]|nr:class II fructose-bisphosphatase [Terrimicrobiaceae bacterium]
MRNARSPRGQDIERNIEFEFVRATENAALNSIHWMGRGEKEVADAAACDAIYGVFDLVDICGEVVIGEGIKDNAPGIFLGDKLGTWADGAPRFDIALDPIDGTSNIAKGLPNSISVMSAAYVARGKQHCMMNIPSFYVEKLAYGPQIDREIRKRDLAPISLDNPFEKTLIVAATALRKRISELVIVMLDRPRNQKYIDVVRREGASLRMIADGDIAAAVAPSLPDSGVDLYVGIGGAPEGVLTASALKALDGVIQLRMWPRDDAERADLLKVTTAESLSRIYFTDDLVSGDSSIFCATGISDSALLPGVKLVGRTAITHSILMRARSRTVRYIRAVHNLAAKTIHVRSSTEDRKL